MPAPSFVSGQNWTTSLNNGATVTLTLSTPTPTPGVGKILVLISAFNGGSGNTVSLTATGGTNVVVTARLAIPNTASTVAVGAYEVTYDSAPTSLTFANAGGGGMFAEIYATELANAVFDVVSPSVVVGTTANAVASNLPSTTSANGLTIGLMTYDPGGNFSQAPGSGWTELVSLDSTNIIQVLHAIYKQTAAGSNPPTWSNTAVTSWHVLGISYAGTPDAAPKAASPAISRWAPTGRGGFIPRLKLNIPRLPQGSGAVLNTLTLTATIGSSALDQTQVNATRSATGPASGVVARQVNATRSATSPSSGAIVRAVQAVRSAAASSAAAVVRQAQKVLAASAGSTATLVAIRAVLLTLSATQAAAASLQRAITTAKSATSSSVAVLVRQVQKTFSVSQAESATVATLKAKLLTLSASIGSSALVQKAVASTKSAASAGAAVRVLAVQAVRSAAQSAAASITRSIQAARQATQASAATLVLQRVVLLTLSASTSAVATLSKQISMTQTAVATVLVASVLKLTVKSLTVSASSVAQVFRGGVPVWPAPADVRAGVVYGPTGTEYTGTLVATGGGGAFIRRR